MRIIYNKPRGFRVKKGTFKYKGKRSNIFIGMYIINNKDYIYWSNGLNKWCTIKEACGFDCSNFNNNIINLKQAIRHIKKHKELKRGIKLVLASRFSKYDIMIII